LEIVDLIIYLAMFSTNCQGKLSTLSSSNSCGHWYRINIKH